jgi:hypothetical protein
MEIIRVDPGLHKVARMPGWITGNEDWYVNPDILEMRTYIIDGKEIKLAYHESTETLIIGASDD